MAEIYNCLPRPASKGKCRKVFSEKHSRKVRVSFDQRPCQSQLQCSNYLTMLPTNILYATLQ